jgi:hypothetical protein
MTRTAAPDPRLRARVLSSRALLYEEGEDHHEDRPKHVRAASGLGWWGGALAVVQDDANFVALVEPSPLRVRALPLPRGQGGLRLFGDDRGNKKHKLDLECCASVPLDGERGLAAFGSGSHPARERMVLLSSAGAQVLDLALFYEKLRNNLEFAGSELNVEGAACVGDALYLFQRGNGAPRGALAPVNAVGQTSWSALWAWAKGAREAPPPLDGVARYDLGLAGRIPWGFTEATVAPAGRLLCLMCAEDSPDAQRDGESLGARVGVLEPGGAVRFAPLLDPAGLPTRDKAEGLALDPHDPTRAWVVLDPDDVHAPARLLEVALEGPWFGA